ncbi:hypothetical protein AB0C34_16570 [Nocardia sp. NPDC049220]|uniref:hypothetical protein n=1 Tax=Nocardia sp. NPDC049220 TaxID=3155273 RepID=UPI003404253F
MRPDLLFDLSVDSTHTADLAAAVTREHSCYRTQQQRAFDSLLTRTPALAVHDSVLPSPQQAPL